MHGDQRTQRNSYIATTVWRYPKETNQCVAVPRTFRTVRLWLAVVWSNWFRCIPTGESSNALRYLQQPLWYWNNTCIRSEQNSRSFDGYSVLHSQSPTPSRRTRSSREAYVYWRTEGGKGLGVDPKNFKYYRPPLKIVFRYCHTVTSQPFDGLFQCILVLVVAGDELVLVDSTG